MWLGKRWEKCKIRKTRKLKYILDNSFYWDLLITEKKFLQADVIVILENKVNLKGEYKLKKFKGYEIKKNWNFKIKNCMIVDIYYI